MTLEYGIARGVGAKAFIAFNPDKTELHDVPTDVRGYDRLQYTDFNELRPRCDSRDTGTWTRASAGRPAGS